jgi:AcrR family transcriptional regulator
MPARLRRDPLTPRKSPAQSRSGKTVDAILEAAAHILESKGLGGYTTNAIAARAGVSIGSVYQYFGGKDAITVALIARESVEVKRDIALASVQEDGRVGLVAMIRAAVRHQLRRPKLARLLDFEESRLPRTKEQHALHGSIHAAVVTLLSKLPVDSLDDIDVLAHDAFVITRSLVDAAADRGDVEPNNLERRVGWAVFGYLGIPLRATSKERSPY